ncbi:MAG: ABC transporter permease [Bryobacteraceae bacterium]
MSRELDEELHAHIAEAIEHGRDRVEARRAFGAQLQRREESYDLKLIPWLDSLRADFVFGWRQLWKMKITSAAAILSLALAIGSCTSAFRIIDALLLRPLPISDPGNLFALLRQVGLDGKPKSSDSYEFPLFRQMREAVQGQAELIAVSFGGRTDLTYASDQEMEKAYRQFVSGWMFPSFGLRPTIGRLFTEDDDREPGQHPYAVLSHDYWTRRFGQDTRVIGRSLRIGNDLFEIIGVGPAGFTGTEPGTATDIFLPTMMYEGVKHADWAWLRTFVRMEPGVAAEPVLQKLRATFHASNEERAKEFTGRPKTFVDRFLSQGLVLAPAAAGLSNMQKDYRVSLIALGVLVGLVLLIACANVANLMTAQAAARAREMALRASIGAGRWRLVQLVLVESALLALIAAAIGVLFAWWAAPFIVGRINPADNPARLALPAGWRVLGFALFLTAAVTFLFGLIPALRASQVLPASALKGGDDPHSRRRLMHALIAVQVAFCFLVLFVGGLFVSTFDKLSQQPTGFSAERLLALDTVSKQPQPPALWNQVAEHLRGLPGVEKVALAGWPLLSGNGSNGFVAVNGGPAFAAFNYFLSVSPGWIDTMKIRLIDGRDFRLGDAYPGTAIVSETFARQYFGGENPVGKTFDKVEKNGVHVRFQIVGLAGDARQRDMREPLTPTVYVPFQSLSASGAIVVRTSGSNPLAVATMLRLEVSRARPEFRVSNIRTQQEINLSNTVRERLLAVVALFFSIVALLLAAVGLYGVLDYSVLQRRREIGIRMAVGAPAGDIVRRVTVDVFAMVLVGAAAGLALGMTAVRSIESLLYQVKASDWGMLALPCLTILAAAVLAAMPAVIRAVRIDPVATLRSE